MPWVPLVAGHELGEGQVRSTSVGDLDLVVWRTQAGEAVVMDARCPHQWSHLEAEGVVDGDELVCTSHFWRFGPDGCGTKVNVNGRRDDKAPTVVYPCRETDGRVEALVPDVDEDPGEHSLDSARPSPADRHLPGSPADEQGGPPIHGSAAVS